jgi:hypothetical protein
MIKVLTWLSLIVVALIARDNPFVPTQTFVHEKQSILENTSKTKNIQNKNNFTNSPTTNNDILSNDTSQTLGSDDSRQSEYNMPVNRDNENFNTTDIDDILVKESQPLPFLNIKEYEKSIVISSKHKIIKKFMILNPYKIAIDFKGKVIPNSRTIKLNSLFSKLVYGNHPQKGYYRIVLYSNIDPRKYKRIYTDNTIVIKE